MIHKLIIIGGGPTAWSAAIYTGRGDLQPLVLVGEKSGGQLMLTTVIENFPGFPNGVDGPVLMMQMREQAERFGAHVVEETVMGVSKVGDVIEVTTGKHTYQAQAVIIATGAEAVWLNVPGEKELVGRGVSTCAVCDAAFFRNKKTIVVGGGDAAMEDALALTKFAESVTLVHRRDSFRASKVMSDRVLANPKVSVRWNSIVEQIEGTTKVTGVKLLNTTTNKSELVEVDGVFIAIGHKPTTSFLPAEIEKNAEGYIVTRLGLEQRSVDQALKAISAKGLVNHPTMTSVEGIFAAGDCVDFRWRQAIIASGMGVMAALDAEWWLSRR